MDILTYAIAKRYTDKQIRLNIGNISTDVDLSEYYTKSQTDNLIAGKVAEIVADAPKDFDTLKEMSDWIANHEDSAAAMNSAIAANTTAIANKVDKVSGKGLSTNDFTNAAKSKLDSLENYDDTEVKADITNTAEQVALNSSTLGYQRKNLLMNNCKNTTKNGVTATVNADGSITLNGTNTASSTKILYWNMQTGAATDTVVGQYVDNRKWLPNGKYILSCATTGMSLQMVFSTDNASESRYKSTGADGTAEFEVTDADKYVWTRLRIVSGAAFDNVTVYPMIRLADVTDDTYEPYKLSVQEQIDDITGKIFGLGNRISANSDLNSYTTAGVYYVLNASDSATVSNNPSKTAGFRLEVSKVSTESGFKQTLYPNTTMPTLYIRYYSSAGFSSWYKFSGTEVTTT